MKYLLPNVPKYFKANLHTHTNVSDGGFTPKEVKQLYQSRGYQIVAYTDHEVCIAHKDLADEDFLPLTAYELSTNAPWNSTMPKALRKTYHLNFISKDPDNRWQVYDPKRTWGNAKTYEDQVICDGFETRSYDPDCINDIIARANAHGFLVTYNHPGWSQQSYPDYAPLKGLWGAEVYNNECVRQGYDDNNSVAYHDLLKQGSHICPVAADDFHRMHDERCISGGWNMIGAKSLCYRDVIEAMEKGDCYATTGPEITALTLDGDILTLSCSEAVTVDLITHFQMAKRVAAPKGKTVTQAQFDLALWKEYTQMADVDKAFFRLVVTDREGNRAYTRAYWYNEL